MGDFAKLLEPISSESPVGTNLYYAEEFDKIKDARRQDVNTAGVENASSDPALSKLRGLWEREVKTADYKLVARLIEDTLTTKTKDLRLAVWLAGGLDLPRRFRLA